MEIKFNLLKRNELFSLLRTYQKAIDYNTLVSITNRTGKILYVNNKFCEVSKYSKNELIGSNHRIINSGFHPKSFFSALWETIEKGQKWHGEIKNKDKTGSFYWVDTLIIPIKTSSLDHYLSLRTVISEKKEMERLRNISMIEGQEIERLRISREIHDGIGQIMTAVKLSSESINESSFNSQKDLIKLEYTKELIIKAINELRQISNDLSPTHLYDFGLFLSVELLVNQVQKISNIEVDLNSNIQDVRFLSIAEVTIYRIIQEAITNVLKYSSAKKLSINLNQNVGFLELLIEDDGIGADLKKPKKYNSKGGNGLKNMSARANSIGAIFKIKTSLGNGFQVILKIPLENVSIM